MLVFPLLVAWQSSDVCSWQCQHLQGGHIAFRGYQAIGEQFSNARNSWASHLYPGEYRDAFKADSPVMVPLATVPFFSSICTGSFVSFMRNLHKTNSGYIGSFLSRMISWCNVKEGDGLLFCPKKKSTRWEPKVCQATAGTSVRLTWQASPWWLLPLRPN